MPRRLRKLRDQVLIITGASSGIGLVTARMAAARGARLVLAARSERALRQLEMELARVGGDVAVCVADVSRIEDVRRIAETALDRFGRFDTWVNNAAVSIYGSLMEIPLEEHRRVMDTNYWGYVHGSLTAVEHLRRHGGTIINIGSVLGDRAIPMQGPYCASKHALKAFTESLRMEIDDQDLPISVTLIKPSAIDTPYKDHAKNYFPEAPQNPPPVYAPETVARTVLLCAEHPRRDVVVGGFGTLVSAIGYNASWLTDRVMGVVMDQLQRTDRPAGPRGRHILFEPSEDLRERGGYGGHVAESSLYTEARLRPWTTAALALGAGVAVGTALWATSGVERRKEHG